MLADFLAQFAMVLAEPRLLGLSALGVLLGIVFGCLPGISSTMSLAILLPVTYALSPQAAMIFLMAVFSASVYGGSISAILINIPGTPGAIVTQLDGYPLARKGRAGEALFYSLLASTVGGVLGLAVLMLVAPFVAGAAMQFRSPEFAMATVFGLTMLAYSTPGSTFRGLLSGSIGLLCGMVGFDATTDVARFDFGSSMLQNGIELVPVTIGLFGLAEVMRNIDGAAAVQQVTARLGRLLPAKGEIRRLWPSMLRGSAVGITVGAIPAAGSAIAVAVSYAQEQRLSPRGREFGTGVPEGITGPESANNACVGGALIPMMTLGIPGDTMTAVLMGALLIHGLRPGPLLFAEHAGFVGAVYVALFLALVFTAVFGLALMRQFVRLLQTPSHVLLVIITLLCVVGAFAIRNNMTDVYVMLAFGVVGYLMYALAIPVAPLAFGLILGPLLEENLRRSLVVGDGSWLIFLERPLAAALLALSLAALVYPALAPALRRAWTARSRGRKESA
ncbi:MAG: C4-dicarboxylate ABC transporter permease [Bradyrhizobiaceae bacterium]|nr:MAG: C4-dicarboxylate ABC transporter permease [Bradyrhizobiaceae bacterium]